MRRIVTFVLFCFFVTVSYAEKINKPNDFFVKKSEVQVFIKEMVSKHHFARAELIALFESVPTRPIHISKINAKVEQKSWFQYKVMFINDERIKKGLAFWEKHKAALQRAEKEYGVPASMIVATIGVESKYGEDKGNYRVIDALVNLSFNDTSRTNYFRTELENFLLLMREQHLDPLSVKGSYAGAIGQPQFMPRSYRYYAVNFSGKPPIDLSNNEDDVIGSIANYYKKNGWHTGELVATPLSLAHGQYRMSLNGVRSMSMIKIIRADSERNDIVKEKDNKKPFKLITLRENYHNDYWLVFHNFNVIKRYNPSSLYAMAVYQLSYYLQTIRGNSDDKENSTQLM